MKGDFSKSHLKRSGNFNGVLHQQGRVLLDADWNEQTRMTNEWQDTAARDVIGPGVAAVPTDTPHAFKITAARVDEFGQVRVTVAPGRVWANGLLLDLEEETELPASHLGPQVQDPFPDVDRPPGPGVRDAVILEVWREAVNGFQEYETLIEPALGGPDTTERVHTAMALRLFRLAPGEACETIRRRLENNSEHQGQLKVSLIQPRTRDADCPVVEDGGYSGFEHNLYRIEIARVNDGGQMFKWSRFNGGLVGRGEYLLHDDRPRFSIKANQQAIRSVGQETFYLEVLEPDSRPSDWRVTYGATVVLNGDDLEVSEAHYSRSELPEGNVFFRLWDGIERIAAFETVREPAETNHLRDGILIEFDPEGRGHYEPEDYWTFSVRAGQSNPNVLLRRQLPEGIRYHRVPLAELHWGDTPASVQIEDCRHVFNSLSRQKLCCSYTVGDGLSTHGDYDSIQEALDKLPPWGGELCLLPGFHRASVRIEGKFNVTIKGCGLRTVIVPSLAGPPIFNVSQSWYVTIEHMLLATFGGIAVHMERSWQLNVRHNHIFAYRHAVHIAGGAHFHIHDNVIRMFDRPGGDVAVLIAADDGVIARNDIAVFPAGTALPGTGGRAAADPADECVEPGEFEANSESLLIFLNYIVRIDPRTLVPSAPFRALGGIQIGSGSDRIKILENRIGGGDGNGITLGSNLDVTGLPMESESRDYEIANTERTIWAEVWLDGELVNDVSLRFEGSHGPYAATSGENSLAGETGMFRVAAERGSYRARVLTPGYRITDYQERSLGEFGRRHVFHIARVQVDIDLSVLDFIYDVVIEGNEIFRMGLSGIGTPQRNLAELLRVAAAHPGALNDYPLIRALATRFGVVGGLVVDLNIRDNHIYRCMQNPFGIEMQLLALVRGEGGISLGLCENVIIHDNRIEDNGQSHIEPLCGVFISQAAQADISHNQIVNNGPLNPGAGVNLRPGIRGGVIIRYAVSLMIHGGLEAARLMFAEESSAAVDPEVARLIAAAAVTGGYAARIHDNLVKQPVGQALRMTAMGAVSAVNNQFSVDFANNPNIQPGSHQRLERRAGAVLVVNLGGQMRAHQQTTSEQPVIVRTVAFRSASGTSTGNILFSNNQTRLGLNTFSQTAQMIFTFDDLGFDNNQVEVLAEINPVLWVNTALYASTLRATNNRLKEPEHEPRLSLDTRTWVLNNTSNNQGNHCIRARTEGAAEKLVALGNTAVLRSLADCHSLNPRRRGPNQ